MGLEPEQIKQLDTLYLEKCQEVNNLRTEIQKIHKTLNEAAVQTETIATQHKAYVCDELCKHPAECKSQEQLNDVCARCRIDYFGILLKKAVKENADV